MDMHGFEPMEMSRKRVSRAKWNSAEVLSAFAESGEECARRDYGDDAPLAYRALRWYAAKHGMPVRVAMRGTLVLLERKDG